MQRITDEEIVNNSGVALDVAASVAFALKILSGGSPKVSIPVRNIVNEEALRQLVNSKNASSITFQAQILAALFESNIQLPPPVS